MYLLRSLTGNNMTEQQELKLIKLQDLIAHHEQERTRHEGDVDQIRKRFKDGKIDPDFASQAVRDMSNAQHKADINHAQWQAYRIAVKILYLD